ncbi:MAG TPA: hypothetical protein VLC46_16440 [Thermoanaerobaculia bacterium]|jgi:hypothetical protein|nr:hypothetical protein [Thermoanaerobaculia bacterium]
MPAMIIDDAYLTNVYSQIGVMDVYSSSDPSRREEHVETATEMIRSAALNDYTPESFDALTIDTAPLEMKLNCARLVLGLLTDGDSARPVRIDNVWAMATQYLSFLAGGSTNHVPPLVKLGGDDDSAGISYVAQRDKFRGMWDPRRRPARGW